jgi:hypothetical protein
MKTTIFFATLLFIVYATRFSGAQPAAPIPSATLPRTAKPPVINGGLNDACWKNALVISDFIITWGTPATPLGEKPEQQTTAYLLYDEEYLYIGVDSFDKDTENIVTGKMERRDSGWADDNIEIFIDPGLTRENFFHLIINAAGVILDQKVTGARESEISWDSNQDCAVKVYEDRWTVEIRMPFAEMGLSPETGSRWGFNITRFEPRSWIVQSWGPVFGNNLQPDRFGIIEGISLDYSRYECRLKMTSWGALSFGGDYIEFEVENYTDKKKDVTAELLCLDGNGKQHLTKRIISLNPGEEKKLSLDYLIYKKGVEGKIILSLKTAGDTKKSFIRTRYFIVPSELFTTALDKRDYYLSEDKVCIQVLLNIGRRALKKSKLIFTVADSSGKTVLSKEIGEIQESRLTATLDMRKMPAGRYTMKAVMQIEDKTVDTRELFFNRIKGPFDD